MVDFQVLKVGLIGLSSKKAEGVSPGFWAQAAHLPSILHSPHYTLTALCNSSLEAANTAIKLHELDPKQVRAFGDPESLAVDKDVDLVVCSINVAKHYDVIKPALEAGKMVICEWPLGSNLQQMKDLAQLAKARNIRTAVGLQGQFSDLVEGIRVLVHEQHRVGRVLSTSMLVHGVMLETSVPLGLEYFCDRQSGGNLLTIRTIHLLHMMTSALNQIENYQAGAGTQRKTRPVVDRNGLVIDDNFSCDTPDHIVLHGKLRDGVFFSYQLRSGRPFVGTPVLDWRIYEDEGEIRITTNGSGLQMDD